MCFGKVIVNVFLNFWEINIERINDKFSIWYKWVFFFYFFLSIWVLNFKIYLGENCFVMKFIILKFLLLSKKIFVIFLNINFYISS